MKCNLIKFACCWQTNRNHRAHTNCMRIEETRLVREETTRQRDTERKRERMAVVARRGRCFNWKSIKMHLEWHIGAARKNGATPKKCLPQVECKLTVNWERRVTEAAGEERSWGGSVARRLAGRTGRGEGRGQAGPGPTRRGRTRSTSTGNHWIQFEQFPVFERWPFFVCVSVCVCVYVASSSSLSLSVPSSELSCKLNVLSKPKMALKWTQLKFS